MNLHACAHARVALTTGEEHGRAQAWWACADCGTPFAPIIRAVAPPAAEAAPPSDYLSIHELAARIPYSVGGLRNLMSAGKLERDVHYVKKNNGRVIFLWRAMQAWVEEGRQRTGSRG